jgi:3-hydroxyacyl-[acyl-carrier-protein] dehydratase
MQFHLVDRIEQVDVGKRIVTSKALSLAEEYLADHFPAFPVMPGVLMIESMVQAAAWLVRIEQDFSRSMVVLTAVRNVKYTYFVKPGNILRCEVEAMAIGPETSKFKAAGYVGDRQAVAGRIELRSFNLVDENRGPASSDESILAQLRQRFELVGGPAALASAGPV